VRHARLKSICSPASEDIHVGEACDFEHSFAIRACRIARRSAWIWSVNLDIPFERREGRLMHITAR
jgi:hypothetical protein